MYECLPAGTLGMFVSGACSSEKLVLNFVEMESQSTVKYHIDSGLNPSPLKKQHVVFPATHIHYTLMKNTFLFHSISECIAVSERDCSAITENVNCMSKTRHNIK